MAFDYDLFVIGAGSGGVRCSRVASQLGAKVAVAEDLYLGGTCVNVGCVPKKLFVYASEFSEQFASAPGFGWDSVTPNFDWQKLRENKNDEIARLNGIYNSILDNAGVDVIHGRATIAGPHEVKVGESIYSAEKILIATGGWPRKPSYPGAEYTMDSNEIFYMDQLPKRILVQGGGYIAVEFAGILNGLGCETELSYRKSLFLRGFDNEIREFVKTEMEKKGVILSFETDIEKIEKREDGSLEVAYTNGETRNVDAVFTAIGRTPKTADLGLENTKVELSPSGAVVVDDNFRTAEHNIYAIGDVIERIALTPVALAEGMALANHLFAGSRVNVDYSNIATAVFCQPNIGTVGLTEEQAMSQGLDIAVYSSDFKALKHTLSGKTERTLMKLIVDKGTDKVLGAHMVGEHAGEIIQGLAIAIKTGATKCDFDQTIGIHPTSAEEFVTMREPTR